jgi:hypothetical protein
MSETPTQVDAPLFDSAAPSEELQEILRRIDENLELRPLLHAAAPSAGAASDAGLGLGPTPPLPDLVDVPERLQRLRVLRAPYFLTAGGGPGAWLKKLLNLPLRLYGVKQHLHNQVQLDAVDLLLDQVRALRQRAEYDDQRARVAMSQLRQLQADTALLVSAQQAASARAEEQSASLQEIRDALVPLRETDEGQRLWIEQVVRTAQQLAEQQQGLHTWIDSIVASQAQLGEGLKGQSDWIALIEREVRGVQFAARDRAPSARGAESAVPEPRILDRAAYDQLVAAMPDGLRVNLGSGVKVKDGWINVDARPLPGVAVVADVRRLPFEPGSLHALEASHLIEHFRGHEMAAQILPYWRSLIGPGGHITIVCPDWQAMIARLQAGELSLPDFTLLTFGGQEYEGNDHFAMYTAETLGQALQAAGFRDVTVVATNRQNGLCPEMELIATA